MRTKIIAGNWKMHCSVKEAQLLARSIVSTLPESTNIETILAPAFTGIAGVRDEISQSPSIKLAAQNVHWAPGGAFTGEISAEMLKQDGCSYVIIGHSERRSIMKETYDMIKLKMHASIEENIRPILCIGETLEDRDAGNANDIIQKQLISALEDFDRDNARQIVIAYEPVWAIGTGKTATPQEANDMHMFIRALARSLFDEETASTIPIIYGGSLKPKNAKEIFSCSDIDGGLIGGASLQAESFIDIIKTGVSVWK